MALLQDKASVWLITGCSSGLGKSLAKYVQSTGLCLVATARDVSSLDYLSEGSNTLKLALDVTSSSNIVDVVKAAVEHFGRLDVVVNAAGYWVVTDFEAFPEDEARNQMETMFWGPVNLTRESLRVFREINPAGQGGTIIQISSMGGAYACQGGSFYHARSVSNPTARHCRTGSENVSKFALEGFTKSVAAELDPKWNISLMLLSPGGVKTNFFRGTKFLPRHEAYAKDPEAPLNAFLKVLHDPSHASVWADPDKCAAVLFNIVSQRSQRTLPRRLNLGADILPVLRGEINLTLKEMEEWEEETLSVMP